MATDRSLRPVLTGPEGTMASAVLTLPAAGGGGPGY
jgi:hypothetical protein